MPKAKTPLLILKSKELAAMRQIRGCQQWPMRTAAGEPQITPDSD
jgi:hypothetical protein